MRRALLMAHENVLDLLLVKKNVIDRKDRAARITEENLDALILQSLDHHFRAGHFLRHCFNSVFSVLAAGNKKGPLGALGQAPSSESGP